MAKAKKSKPVKSTKPSKPAKTAKKPAVKAKAKAPAAKKITQGKKPVAPKAAKKVVKAKALPKAPAAKAGKAAKAPATKLGAKPAGKITITPDKKADKKIDKKIEKTSAAPVPSTLKGQAPKKVDKEKEKAEKIEKKYEGKTPEMVEAQLLSEFQAESEDIVLTDAEGRKYCRAGECDQLSLVDGYCRYHYLFFWKKIQIRKKILSEGKLGRYVEELTSRYPDKFLDILRKDLRSEKDFLAAIQELEMEDGSEEGGSFEDESSNFADEVRGLSSDTPARSDEEF